MSERKPRRSRDELREMMINAGKEVLLQIEPTMGFEELTYTAVFDHLLREHDQKVTLGSVHERLWNSKREFQLAVVAEVLNDPLEPVTRQNYERALSALAAFDTSTLDGRRNAVRTVARQQSYMVQAPPMSREVQIIHSVRFRLWIMGPNHPEAEGFTEALTAIRAASLKATCGALRAIVERANLRIKPEAGDPDEAIEMISLLANATIIGFRTDVLEQAERARMLPTGLNGELEEWYPDALALWFGIKGTAELDGEGLTDQERQL